MLHAKPFIKWVGGKGQLVKTLDALLPGDFAAWQDATYIEPFVGGGAMLFHMLRSYPNISYAVINDINRNLTTCYVTVKEKPRLLLEALAVLQREYDSLTHEQRKPFYLKMRERYNTQQLDDIDSTTMFFFLNRTCFNGLYRVNRSGAFNVPFGRYETPVFGDERTILADSELLQKVTVLTGDFEETLRLAGHHTLFYCDPPYRPLSKTSYFNEYAKEAFNDASQLRLKEFCDRIHSHGHAFMLSNSDGESGKDGLTFFDRLYGDYVIERVQAARCVNANGTRRGKISEIVVRNYR